MTIETPRRFVTCIASIKMADGPLTLYFDPRAYECILQFPHVRQRPGTAKVGTYGPGGDKKLARRVRQDLDEVITGLARGTLAVEP